METPGSCYCIKTLDPVDLVEGLMIEILRHEAVSHTAEDPKLRCLAEQNTAMSVYSDSFHIRVDSSQNTSCPGHRSTGANRTDYAVYATEAAYEVLSEAAIGQSIVWVIVLIRPKGLRIALKNLAQLREPYFLESCNWIRIGDDVKLRTEMTKS